MFIVIVYCLDVVIVLIDIVIAHLCDAQRVDRSVGGWRSMGRQNLLTPSFFVIDIVIDIVILVHSYCCY